MSIDGQTDETIRAILTETRRVAVVGASDKAWRPSHGVFGFLLAQGYDATPVNPLLEGRAIHDRTVVASLADAAPLEMVDIFRASANAGAAVDEAIRQGARVIWMQLGVRNDEAAALAEASGMKVVMNRCPKIEYGRLSSEIGWIGVNSRTLSSKRAQIFGKGVQRMSLNRQSYGGGAAARVAREDENSG